MKVRTRVAPSPTGDPHVGTAYIALFNYCLAKKHGGEFILRVEDTDQVRSTRESEDVILKALEWCGVEWDEGPDKGGPHGPYRQSERSDIYAEHAQKLLEKGHAFRCFCTTERLGEMRAAQRESGTFQGYDGRCISLTEAEIADKMADGVPHIVRMKVPREGVCTFKDHFRGEIEIEWATVDMQVLVKSDGLPTYHLANVVDDHLMEITHVLRGEEWITSAPKHQLLYQYFGWEMPELCHLPLLRNPDKSKLSKRKNPTSILYYEQSGYLPEALLNYLGMMAWTMPDQEEKFSLEMMVENFDLDRISMGAPVFDVQKLDWLNGRYIREDHTPAELLTRLVEWKMNPEFVEPILEIAQKRTERLTDLADMVGFFFQGADLKLTPEDIVGKQDLESVIRVLQLALWQLEALRHWDSDSISETLRDLATRMDMKLRDFLKPFFVTLSGSLVSTPLFDSMEILGPDITRARIRTAIEVLGGVGKKKAKKMEKDLAYLLSKELEADSQ